MAKFTLSLLNPYLNNNQQIQYHKDMFCDYNSNNNQLDNWDYNNYCFSYDENLQSNINAQETLTYKMNKYILINGREELNPYASSTYIGSLIELTDKNNIVHKFVVKDISYSVKNKNIEISYSCQDFFTWQLSKQNSDYNINNNYDDEFNFIGAKNLQFWTDKIINECKIPYSYIPLQYDILLGSNGKYYARLNNDFYNTNDLTTIISNPNNILQIIRKGIQDTTENEDYYRLITFSLSGSSAANALISLGEQYGLMLEVDYINNTFWYKDIKNPNFTGLIYNPSVDLQSLSVSQNGNALATIYNITGPSINDNTVSLLESISPFFINYFKLSEWSDSQYYNGLYLDICNAIKTSTIKGSFKDTSSALYDCPTYNTKNFIWVNRNDDFSKAVQDCYYYVYNNKYYIFYFDNDSSYNVFKYTIKNEAPTNIPEPYVIYNGGTLEGNIFYPISATYLQSLYSDYNMSPTRGYLCFINNTPHLYSRFDFYNIQYNSIYEKLNINDETTFRLSQTSSDSAPNYTFKWGDLTLNEKEFYVLYAGNVFSKIKDKYLPGVPIFADYTSTKEYAGTVTYATTDKMVDDLSEKKCLDDFKKVLEKAPESESVWPNIYAQAYIKQSDITKNYYARICWGCKDGNKTFHTTNNQTYHFHLKGERKNNYTIKGFTLSDPTHGGYIEAGKSTTVPYNTIAKAKEVAKKDYSQKSYISYNYKERSDKSFGPGPQLNNTAINIICKLYTDINNDTTTTVFIPRATWEELGYRILYNKESDGYKLINTYDAETLVSSLSGDKQPYVSNRKTAYSLPASVIQSVYSSSEPLTLFVVMPSGEVPQATTLFGMDILNHSKLDIDGETNYRHEPTPHDLSFAKAADYVPYLENKIIKTDYLQNKYTPEVYKEWHNRVFNNLRVKNGLLLAYRSDYYNALEVESRVISDIQIACDNIGSTLSNLFINNNNYKITDTSSEKDYFQYIYHKEHDKFNTFITHYYNMLNQTKSNHGIVDYHNTISNSCNKYYNYYQQFCENIKNFKDTLLQPSNYSGNFNNLNYYMINYKSKDPKVQQNIYSLKLELSHYWNSAYLASLQINFFLPKNWTLLDTEEPYTASDTNIFTIINSDGTINEKWLPTIIAKSEEEINTPIYVYSDNPTSEEIDTNKYDITWLKDHLHYSDAEIKAHWRIEENSSVKTRVYVCNNGISWKQLCDYNYLNQRFNYEIQYGSCSSDYKTAYSKTTQFSMLGGWYQMYCLILKSALSFNSNNYQEAYNNSIQCWKKLEKDFGPLMLETSYKSETATTRKELLSEAEMYYREYEKPQKQYSLSTIDICSLKGYEQHNICIGDQISLAANDLYEEQDEIKSLLEEKLFINSISYTLRKDTDITYGVDTISYQDKLISKLIKLIK